jgi:predicted CXXCH cytochrome family protein
MYSKKFMRFISFSTFCFVLAIIVTFRSDTAYAQPDLKTEIPALCYDCHKGLKDRLSSPNVHILFKQGKCITCHNAHASDMKGLLNDDITGVCLGCHEDINNRLRSATVHSPLRENPCIKCHSIHGGEHKSLLVKSEKDLCWDCHEGLKEQIQKPYACLPFKEGKCSSCHDSHGSAHDTLLTATPNKLCRECHAPKCKAGGVSIASAVEKLDCTSCHSGHSSQDKGILGPYGHTVFLQKDCGQCHNPITSGQNITTKAKDADLCFSCHNKSDSNIEYIDNDIHVINAENPCDTCHDHHASKRKNLTKNELNICADCHENILKRIASMQKALKTIRCIPVRERRCFECHVPTHSSQPLKFRKDIITVCSRCHESQHKITHPLGKDVIDPRSGQPLTCISCHSMHSAKAEFMLAFDRKRALCIQCHKL